MSSDTLTHFGCLDELVQIVYQGVHRFVILSNLDDEKWTIHLGLSGPEGRWWRGIWTEADILEIVGSKSSSILLEAFAEKLVETFVKGELYIGDWSPEKGAKIKLTLGPSSKKPIHIPLVELSSEEAASHATSVFLDIALQAQSRKCRLDATPYSSVSASVSSPPPRAAPSIVPASVKTARPDHTNKGSDPSSAKTTTASMSDQKAQEEIKALKAELVKQQKRNKSPAEAASSKSVVSKRPLKGASLANPNKKARKYQAIEFESDDE